MDVEQALHMADGGPHHASEWAEIARTLAAEVRRLQGAVPAGHVRDEKGVDRRLDMTGWSVTNPHAPVDIPTFADGSMWMMNEEAYAIVDGEVHEFYCYDHTPSYTSSGWVLRWGDGEIVLSECYSTRAAAEAARSKA